MDGVVAHGHGRLDNPDEFNAWFTSRDWHNDRKFDPSEYWDDATEGHREMTVNSWDEEWTYMACGNSCKKRGEGSCHYGEIMVAVAGISSNQKTNLARSAIGVHFRKGNAHNIAEKLQGPSPHTTQRASLTAAREALKEIIRIKEQNVIKNLYQVVIKADSLNLVKGMTKWILKWRTNGYNTNGSGPVVNSEYFKTLDELVDTLNGMGVAVLFWHVQKAENGDADLLAYSALGRLDRDQEH